MVALPGVAIVTILALLEYAVLGMLVGRARGKYGVEAPATAGHPEFERYFRVHQNTLESLITFIPALWLFASFISASAAVALGLVFIVARIIYAAGYIKDSKRRGPGAMLSFLVTVVLLLGGLMGAVMESL
jgi:uncharacterized membrane protein YecN with MAPEG domain